MTGKNTSDVLFDSRSLFSSAELNAIYIGYGTVLLFGVATNLLVCYLILKYHHLHTSVNILLLNLAASDTLAVLSVIPYAFLDMHRLGVHGTTADLLCGLEDGLSLFFVGSLVSLLTLSLLSVSRYLVINHPLKHNWRLTKHHLKCLLVVIWIVSFLFLVPSFLSYTYDSEKRVCMRTWAKGINPVLYFTATAVIGLIIPLSTLSFTYACTFYTLWIKNSPLSLQGERSVSHKKRAVILLGALMVVYILCWLPFGIYWLLSVPLKYFSKNVKDEIQAFRVAKAVVFAAMCNAVLDPVVYAFSSRQLRYALRQTIRGQTMNAVRALPMPTIER